MLYTSILLTKDMVQGIRNIDLSVKSPIIESTEDGTQEKIKRENEKIIDTTNIVKVDREIGE